MDKQCLAPTDEIIDLVDAVDLDGRVKWFSQQKGYGFLCGPDETDYYYHISAVRGENVPEAGDHVTFTPKLGPKGARAADVRLKEKGVNPSDSRVACLNCGRKMVPRLHYSQGVLCWSDCPFCGATYRTFSSSSPLCFIATAVYGSPKAPNVRYLRWVRDSVLATSSPGRRFIAAYYRLSPPVAYYLRYAPRLAACVRLVLDTLVLCLKRSRVAPELPGIAEPGCARSAASRQKKTDMG